MHILHKLKKQTKKLPGYRSYILILGRNADSCINNCITFNRNYVSTTTNINIVRFSYQFLVFHWSLSDSNSLPGILFMYFSIPSLIILRDSTITGNVIVLRG